MRFRTQIVRIRDFVHTPFKKAGHESGMTLIEIILVISLMATLMGILITNLTGTSENAKKDASLLAMMQLGSKLTEYKIHVFRFPTTDQGLEALFTNPGSKRWRGPYLKKKTKIMDPWDVEFGYESDGRHYKIISAGSDNQLGSEDDVTYDPEGEEN